MELCKRGHPRTEENTYWDKRKNHRACKPCMSLVRRNPALTAAARQEREDRNAAIRAMVAEGVPPVEIAKVFGVSPSTVYGVAPAEGRFTSGCETCGGEVEEGQAKDCRACVDLMIQIWKEAA